MTDTDTGIETLAQRIAERGHDALVERLRRAYADAAAAHADLISLDHERIEAMVQSAAEHADGLQWRRALAGVAAEELGVSVGEALRHPAVARAQALVGAPSYEQSLAEMIARPVPPAVSAVSQPGAMGEPANGAVAAGPEQAAPEQAGPEQAAPEHGAPEQAVPETATPEPADVLPEPEPPTPEPEPEPEPVPPVPVPTAESPVESPAAAEPASDQLETVEADDVVLELLPEPDPVEYETQTYDVVASFTEEDAPPALEPELSSPAAESLSPPAPSDEIPEQHPTEVAPPDEVPGMEPASDSHDEQPELVIPAIHLGGVANLPTKREGLGVRLSADGLDILQGEREIVGRLVWDEIETLEVPNQRSRRRRSEPRARLLVRTPHGDASFDVPGLTPDELRDRVEPLVQLFGRH